MAGRGADPQLERAVSIALELLAANAPHRPVPAKRPRLLTPGLAPRPVRSRGRP